jgi:uncharacterized membrane protein
MTDAHYHLVFNHLPIIVPIVGLFVLFAGFIFKSEHAKRTAFGIFIFGAVMTIPAFKSGEEAEEVVEHIAGIEHKLIHAHEELAETFAILSYLLGGLALAAFWASVKGKKFATLLTYVLALFAIVTIYFAQQTGTTGGEIRHTEIRADFVPSANGEEEDGDKD